MIRTLRWAALLFLSASSAWSLDLELSTRYDTFYWAPTRDNDTAGYTFRGSDLFWNVQGSVTQELQDGLLFKGGVDIDPILRWRAYSQLSYTLENMTLQFAPFLGIFDSTQKWFNPGLEANVQYTWPGFMFVRGGFLTTFAPVSKTGDYYLSGLSAAVGALLENGIVTFKIEDKSATFRINDTLTTVDETTKYWVDTEMFLKNVPFRWAVLTGYQVTKRSYVETGSEVNTPVHSLLLGGRFSWDFGSGTTAYVQGETSFFNTGWDSTVMDMPSSTVLFDLIAGVRYHW
jgi:hypothetical protein